MLTWLLVACWLYILLVSAGVLPLPQRVLKRIVDFHARRLRGDV